ncbi:FHA domain-containing protein [Luteolibacter flavescens]|uniref:FHA domain-containing protein n=1 Tax=Luteolibacter flavescens TaxID=1859460 RepID=A0ABT3FSE5_9BACT|nr:FHA domain-containing protein [Luteolibacter flavescens]MCW1886490.1 FHA domain-containing protein [Luteolibacter flavescens]
MPRVTITVADRTPQPYRFLLDRMKVNMGRGSENDIVIDDGSVSVRHAVMERIDGGYQLRDVGSTNGIKLEGIQKEIIPLRHGLSVKIGDVAFDFTLTEEEREALAREKPPEESPIIKEDPSAAAAGGGPRKAANAPGAGPQRVIVQSSQPSAAASFFMTLIFLVLAAGAFYVGLTVRHEKETGGNLLEAIKSGRANAPALPENLVPAGEKAAE